MTVHRLKVDFVRCLGEQPDDVIAAETKDITPGYPKKKNAQCLRENSFKKNQNAK